MINSATIKKMEKEWDKRGFYQVGPQKFYSKAQAILDSQTSGHFPEFNFNDSVFSKANWAVEPSQSLKEIYRARAQQLREKYDYLVLSYSSGSDSTNILHSFLHNNIKLDEVFCYGPFSTTQGHTEPLTRDAENNYREIDLIAIPYLKELQKTYDFKITIHDTTQDMINGFKSVDWIWTESQSRLSPSIVARNRLHSARNHLQLSDAGKKVAFIFGIDKPKVILKNGEYYVAFIDLLLNMGVGPGALLTGNDWEVDEYFYWTPDMPEIVVKQGHVIKNFIEANPVYKCLVENSDQGNWHEPYSARYFDLVKRLIYPTFNADLWQTNKISSLTYTEHDGWFINANGFTAKEIWLAGLRELERNLDKKWFNQGTIDKGFVGSWSKWHKLGT